MSSSSPAIIIDKESKKVVMIVGAAGGSRITSCTAQIILNILLRGLDPLDVMEKCRMHHQLLPNHVNFAKIFTCLNFSLIFVDFSRI